MADSVPTGFEGLREAVLAAARGTTVSGVEEREEANAPTENTDGTYRVDGMTMTVPNPEYASKLAQREMLLMERRKVQVASEQATLWARQLIPRAQVPFPDPALRMVHADIESALTEIFDDGTWIAVPPPIHQKRTQRIRSILATKFGKLLAEKRSLYAGAIRVTLDRASGEVLRSIPFYPGVDFSRVAVTREEVDEIVNDWFGNVAEAQGIDVPDEEDLFEYRSALVRAYGEPARVQKNLDAWLTGDDEIDQSTEGILRQTVLALPNNGYRYEKLPSDAELLEKLLPDGIGKVLVVLMFSTAARAPNAPENFLQFVEEREEEEIVQGVKAILSENRGNRDLEGEIMVDLVQKIRMIGETVAIGGAAETRLDAVDRALSQLTPTVTAPLVAQLGPGSAMPEFRVRVIDAKTSSPTLLEFEFQWYQRIPGSDREILLRKATQRGSDSFTPPRPTGPREYRVVARGPGGGNYVSAVARVFVVARCKRCLAIFDENAERVHGECLWRQHPLSRKFLKRALVPEHGRGVGEGDGPDDFLVDTPRGPTSPADEELLLLGAAGPDELRRRFFTFRAVLRNLDARVQARLESLQGANVSEITSLWGGKRGLLGAISSVFEKPNVGLPTIFSADPEAKNDEEPGDIFAEWRRADVLVARPEGFEGTGRFEGFAGLHQFYGSELAYYEMVKVVERARGLDDLPLQTILFVILHSAQGEPLRALLLPQEDRFLRQVQERFWAFATLYASFAVSSEHGLVASLGPSANRLVFLGRPGTSTLVIATPSIEHHEEACRQAVVRLSRMTASQIAQSTAWRYGPVSPLALASLGDAQRSLMFEDDVGLANLLRRIATARSQSRADATAGRFRPSPLNDPRGFDWRGIHSSVSDQPDLYEMDPEKKRILKRASERLASKCDWALAHAAVKGAEGTPELPELVNFCNQETLFPSPSCPRFARDMPTFKVPPLPRAADAERPILVRFRK